MSQPATKRALEFLRERSDKNIPSIFGGLLVLGSMLRLSGFRMLFGP